MTTLNKWDGLSLGALNQLCLSKCRELRLALREYPSETAPGPTIMRLYSVADLQEPAVVAAALVAALGLWKAAQQREQSTWEGWLEERIIEMQAYAEVLVEVLRRREHLG